MKILIPMKLESTANKRWHWAVKSKHNAEQRAQGKWAVSSNYNKIRNEPPFKVKITRIGKRMMDDDNLAISAKALRDGIAEALGVDDGDKKLIAWKYDQKIGKEYGVEVEIK